MSSSEKKESDEPVGSIHQERSHSPIPSCVSMESDMSIEEPPKFGEKGVPDDQQVEEGAASNMSLSEEQHTSHRASRYQQIHKSNLQKKFQCLTDGIPQQGESRLHEIYTELYIMEEGRGEVNDEHEVQWTERASWKKDNVEGQGKPIKCSEIFNFVLKSRRKSMEEERTTEKREEKDSTYPIHNPFGVVLTKGVAGIGKTVSVHKFILDWAEGKNNQDIHFIFPFFFRELNLMKDKKLSLFDLIQHFFPEIKDPSVLNSPEHRSVIILDGMDECRLSLDFCTSTRCCDVTEPVSVDMLLTNLIKGNLLPSALLWITTRPAAASQIPTYCVKHVTEIRGFTDPQKEEYFRKKLSDENLAITTITHLKSSRSLYIMCHVPIFCWITATVVESTSKQSEKVEIPRTLTQMYTRFLNIQTNIKKEKYTERNKTDEEVIFELGKLAFQQLEKGNPIFYENDLRECDIDVSEALVYSGVCTQIFREESVLSQRKVFSFVHLSIQEFLAALHVFLCFSDRQKNTPDQQQTSELYSLFKATTLHDLHKAAVKLALKSKNGHLDLFLRFLLGLSLKSNQSLLRHLLPHKRSQSQSSKQTVRYVKQKIRGQSSSDRKINLFYCLNELNHHAVVDKIDRSSGTLCVDILLPGEWETKRFEFKMLENQLAEFDLQKYLKTPEEDQTELLRPEEVLQKLVPVITTSTSAELSSSNLTGRSCSYLASALTSHSSSLRVLNLGSNQLESGMEPLCSALCHQNCKLEELQLYQCNLTERSCSYLASALTSHSSSLRVLDLSSNRRLDSGVELLCAALCHQNCKLEKLLLMDCKLTEKSCSYLVPALIYHSSHLRMLDLTGNELLDTGVEVLCSALCHQNCKLEELQLYRCNLTERSCSNLASALTSPSSSLRVLNLWDNNLSEPHVEQLSALVKNPQCRLEKLILDWGAVTP